MIRYIHKNFGANQWLLPPKHVTSLQVDSEDVLYASTWGGGMFRSLNDGESFTELNNGLDNLFINDIFVDSDDNVWIGSEGGGVYKLPEGTLDWEQMDEGLRHKKVRAVTVNSDGLVFAGTYGGGVYVWNSVDSKWEEWNIGLHYMNISELFIADNGDVVAGTYGGGCYISEDDGVNWAKANSGLGNLYINQIIMNSSGVLFAATNGRGIATSVNNGLFWTETDTVMTDLSITCLALNESNDLVAGSRTDGVYWFDGRSYMEWLQSSIIRGGVTAMTVNSDGVLFCTRSNYGLYISSDKGKTWDWTELFYDDGGYVASSDDTRKSKVFAHRKYDKTWVTFDNGNSWQGTTLPDSNIIDYAIDENGYVYAATEFSGLYKTEDNGQTWNYLEYNQKRLSSVAVNRDDEVFVSGLYMTAGSQPEQRTFIDRSTDNGTTWEKIDQLNNEEEAVDIHIKPGGDIYYGRKRGGVDKSTDNGTTWTTLSDINSTGLINAFKMNKKGYIFTGNYDYLHWSTDDAANWEMSNLGMSTPEISDICFNTSDEMFLICDYDGGIYHIENSSMEWDSSNASIYYDKLNSLGTNSEGYTFLCSDVIYRSIDPAKLEVPQLLSPASNTTGIHIENLRLDWNAADNADLYEFQVSTNDDFTFRIEYVVQADTFRILNRTLDNNTEYYWRVRSKFNSAYSDWSEVRTFRTEIAAPELIFPENNATGIAQAIELLWHWPDGAETFTLKVSPNSDMSEEIIFEEGIEDSTKMISGLQPYKNYYWMVKAFDEVSESPWSATWTFRTVVAPPVLRSPADDTLNLNRSVTMEWFESTGADRYIIQVARDSLFESMVYNGNSSELLSHNIDILEFNAVYYWKVQAGDEDAYGLFSDTWKYTTAYAPVVLTGPDNDIINTDTSLVLTWQYEIDDLKYHLQIAKDAGFNDMILDDTLETMYSYNLNDLEYYQEYYWRIRVINGDRIGLWPDSRKFRTRLGRPELDYPAYDAKEIALTMYVRWLELKGADYYRLQLSTDPLFNNPEHDMDSIEIQRGDFWSLPKNTKHYWRVKGFNSDGEGLWSETWNFTTGDPGSVVEKPAGISEMKIYPNPFQSFVSINLTAAIPMNIDIDIVDMSGRVVRSLHSGYLNSGDTELRWEPSGLSGGVYYIRMQSGSDMSLYKLNYMP